MYCPIDDGVKMFLIPDLSFNFSAYPLSIAQSQIIFIEVETALDVLRNDVFSDGNENIREKGEKYLADELFVGWVVSIGDVVDPLED